MGRPVAVVRAVMRLQVEGGLPAMSEAQRKHAYQVRLGAIERSVDGLLGYFLDNDYSRFHTVFQLINQVNLYLQTINPLTMNSSYSIQRLMSTTKPMFTSRC